MTNQVMVFMAGDDGAKEHEKRDGGTDIYGRATVYVKCPYCQVETLCFIWSLSGSGKRCQCGAKHMGQGYTYAPKPKEKRAAKAKRKAGKNA